MKTTIMKLAVSAAVLGLATVGCKPASTYVASVSAVAPKAEKQAAKFAARAKEALGRRMAADAVMAAESAVALSPRTAEYRMLLGQSYLLAGRFNSAETSFSDAVTLNPNHGRAGMNLALAQIALGHWDAARATLAGLEGKAPESDRGLAIALAGDPEGALTVLEAAARADGATPKARQNLALGYAMAGRWRDAQSTAAQDLDPNALRQRMMEWAQFTQPRSAWDQVAALLGVTPAQDSGQPVALALAPIAAAPVQVAMPSEDIAPVAVAPVVAAPIVAEIAAPAPVMALTDIAPAAPSAVVEAPVAPMTVVPAEAAPTPVMEKPALLVQAAAADVAPASAPSFVRPASAPDKRPAPIILASRPVRAAAPARPKSRGNFVVQLGAFSTAGRVDAAWNRQVGRVGALAAYTPARSTFSTARGVVHRLSLTGFETRAEASSMCTRIRARGGDCFVRAANGEQPVRWVSRKGVTLASR